MDRKRETTMTTAMMMIEYILNLSSAYWAHRLTKQTVIDHIAANTNKWCEQVSEWMNKIAAAIEP